MGTFIAEGAAVLPPVKSDARAPTGAATEWAAEDANELRSAALDLRTEALAEASKRAAADQSLAVQDATLRAMILALPSTTLVGDASGALVTAVGTTDPRMLNERFADVFAVQDFGAVGDGITDDTDALQAAIDAAVANGGGTVSGKAGNTYRITTQLLVDGDNVRLAGNGAKIAVDQANWVETPSSPGGLTAVFAFWHAGHGPAPGYVGAECSNCTVEGWVIDGGDTGGVVPGRSIPNGYAKGMVGHAIDLMVRNNRFQNFSFETIWIGPTGYRNTYEGNVFYNCGWGSDAVYGYPAPSTIQINTDRCVVVGNVLEKVFGGIGGSATADAHTIISGNLIYQFRYLGISAGEYASDSGAAITGNVVVGDDYAVNGTGQSTKGAIFVTSGGGCAVTGNYIRIKTTTSAIDGTAFGIRVEGNRNTGTRKATPVVISGNSVIIDTERAGTVACGIYSMEGSVDAYSDVTVIGNSVVLNRNGVAGGTSIGIELTAIAAAQTVRGAVIGNSLRGFSDASDYAVYVKNQGGGPITVYIDGNNIDGGNIEPISKYAYVGGSVSGLYTNQTQQPELRLGVQNFDQNSYYPLAQLTYGANVAVNAQTAKYHQLQVTDGSAFTISNPTNAWPGMEITFLIYNGSGGAMGTVTWDSAFRLAGAWTSPASGAYRTITFVYEPLQSKWREVARAAADISI